MVDLVDFFNNLRFFLTFFGIENSESRIYGNIDTFLEFQRKVIKILLEIKTAVTDQRKFCCPIYNRTLPHKKNTIEDFKKYEDQLSEEEEYKKLVSKILK